MDCVWVCAQLSTTIWSCVGSGDVALHVLNFGTSWMWGANCTFLPLCTWEKSPRLHRKIGLGAVQNGKYLLFLMKQEISHLPHVSCWTWTETTFLGRTYNTVFMCLCLWKETVRNDKLVNYKFDVILTVHPR